MKKTTIIIALLLLILRGFAQTQSIAGTYEVNYMLLENNIRLSSANKDSMIEAATIKTIDKIIKDGEIADTADVKATHISIINTTISLTIVLSKDGKYSKQLKSVTSEKMEIQETGTYTFNSKTNAVVLIPKVKTSKSKQPLILYNSTNKTLNVIAGKNEPDAGATIVQLIKTK